MRDTIKGLIVVLVVLGAGGYVVDAIITKEQVRQVVQRADDPKSEPVVAVNEGKTEWMAGCDTGELNGKNFNQTTYCVCVFDKLVAHHGMNWIINVGLNDTDEEMTAKITPEATQCVKEQGIEV